MQSSQSKDTRNKTQIKNPITDHHNDDLRRLKLPLQTRRQSILPTTFNQAIRIKTMAKSLLTHRAEIGSDEEWRIHRLHAMIGSFVLAHFMYRYAIFFDGSVSDMGFDYSPGQLLLFLPHGMLQVSGFYFKLPPKRHPEGNRIWSEYRWHALFFFCRSMAYLLIVQVCRSEKVPYDRGMIRLLSTIVMITNLACVDSVSECFKGYGQSSSTIRGLKGPAMVKYLMSATQFHLNVNCLLEPKAFNVQFAALSVVQGSAFGMTLRRRCMISHSQGLGLYAMVLFFGMLVIMDDLRTRGILHAGVAIGNAAAMARIDLGLNKYYMWCFVATTLLPLAENHGDHNIWKAFALMSTLCLLVNGRLHSGV